MILYLARHGETDLNIGDRYQGISDLSLNARGMEQAELLAASLPAGIAHVVASPQRRAYETASVLATARRLPLSMMPEFRERDFGVFEGLTAADARARYPELWAQGVHQQWAAAPPDGETTQEVVKRVSAGLRTLRSAYRDDAVLLVTHGFVVRAVRYLLTGIPKEEFFTLPKIGNGEFLTYALP